MQTLMIIIIINVCILIFGLVNGLMDAQYIYRNAC